jgi:hypothetical protein
MEGEEEFKVYVSRIPSKWSETLFYEHFVSIFGPVERVELFTARLKSSGGIDGDKKRTSQTEPKVKYCYTWKNEGSCDKPDCPYNHGEPVEPVASSSSSSSSRRTKDINEEGGESLGSGIVVFATKEAMENALAQKSMHLSRRIIKISKYASKEDRDVNICHAWAEFRCKHGDSW